MRDLLEEARMQRKRSPKLAIVAAAAIAVSFAAEGRAADGVLEINQACVATGCYPGDPPGFPVYAPDNKSYVLTSNLTVPNANTTAVQLGNYATLDLGGFAITGVTVCTGALTVTCTGTGNGNGVRGGNGVTIRNGVIRRMGDAGISAGAGSLVENLVVEENGLSGIAPNDGRGWIIRGSRIVRNHSYGSNFAVTGAFGLIEGNVVEGNERAGVYGLNLLVLGNSLANNGQEGIAGNFGTQKKACAHNVSTYNNGGNTEDQIEGCVEMGANLCGSSTTCP
jgi:hypothetical protein